MNDWTVILIDAHSSPPWCTFSIEFCDSVRLVSQVSPAGLESNWNPDGSGHSCAALSEKAGASF